MFDISADLHKREKCNTCKNYTILIYMCILLNRGVTRQVGADSALQHSHRTGYLKLMETHSMSMRIHYIIVLIRHTLQGKHTCQGKHKNTE